MNLPDLQNKALIGAWVSPPPKNFDNLDNPDFITLEQYQKIKDSGINVIYGLYENAKNDLKPVLKALDLANEVGIKYLVRDSRLMNSQSKEEFINYLSDYNNKPAYLGILLIDEPGLKDYKQIGKLYTYFKEEFPNKLFYTNLLPLHAQAHQLIHGNFGNIKEEGHATYQQYYDKYFEECRLPYISYDLYPFENEYPKIRDDYFKQHQLMLEYSNKYIVPVYNFIQACSFAKHVRIPTKNEIMWHVNTSIAYGVKGIQYFTYFIPIESTHETFNGSMIDRNGNETKTYYDVKEVNNKITMYLNYLLDKKLKGIITSNNMSYQIPKESIIESKSIKNIIGDDLLIGVFDEGNIETLYIVNTNLIESKNKEFTIELNNGYNFSETIKSNKVFNLECGDALLLQIIKGENI